MGDWTWLDQLKLIQTGDLTGFFIEKKKWDSLRVKSVGASNLAWPFEESAMAGRRNSSEQCSKRLLIDDYVYVVTPSVIIICIYIYTMYIEIGYYIYTHVYTIYIYIYITIHSGPSQPTSSTRPWTWWPSAIGRLPQCYARNGRSASSTSDLKELGGRGLVLLGKSTENHDLHQVSTGVKMGMGQNPGT